MSRQSLLARVKKLGLIAGVKTPVTCHTLRRSRATHLLDAGLGIEQVKRLLRHRNLNTTMKYLNLTTEGLRRKMKGIDPLEK